MSEGTIVRIVGPVVDVDFSEAKKVPKIYDALEITSEGGNENHRLVLEVQQDLGDGWVRAIAMSTTDGLKRGMKLTHTGDPISVPVGEGVLGRVCNVIGEPVDERGLDLPVFQRW